MVQIRPKLQFLEALLHPKWNFLPTCIQKYGLYIVVRSHKKTEKKRETNQSWFVSPEYLFYNEKYLYSTPTLENSLCFQKENQPQWDMKK